MTKLTNLMYIYEYHGIFPTGKKISGKIVAKSIGDAKLELRKQGIISKKLAKKRQFFFAKANKKITQADIAIFSRQLATMIEAGIPLIQSFEIIIKGQSKLRLQQLLQNIKNCVESGMPLAETLAKNPKYFNYLFCNLIEAGEKSGTLDLMLQKIAIYKEKTETIKKKVKKALTYPGTLIIISLLVTFSLLIFVIPQFETFFKRLGADLPTLTRMIINLSKYIQTYWYVIFGIFGLKIYAFLYALKNSAKFSFLIDKILLKLPIFGQIIEKAAIARFARTLSITFAAGLPLVQALSSVARATGNKIFTQAINSIQEEISTGQKLQTALAHTNIFPHMVIQMIAIGEESGKLEQMLAKIADFFEEDIDNTVDSLSSLLEPLVMALLGILVGGIVIAMYLPIFKLSSVI